MVGRKELLTELTIQLNIMEGDIHAISSQQSQSAESPYIQHFCLNNKLLSMRTRQKPDWQQKIAEERIKILFDLAKKEFEKNPQRSRRYVELARNIGTRY